MKHNAKLLTMIVSTAMVAGCGTDAKLQVRPVGAEAVMPVNDLLAQGRADFALNNVALALDQFRRAERLQPTNVSALNGIAACYDRMGRFDLSRLYYEKALALAPTDPKTLHNFELSLAMQGRNNEALALAREMARPATAKQPQLVAAPGDKTVSGNDTRSVTVALVPPAPAPVPVPHSVDRSVAAAAPALDQTLPGPHLERLSLSEVELVTVPPSKSPPTKERQANAGKSRPAERVVKIAQAQLVKQTRTSSEWVFPAEPAKSAAAVAKAPAQPSAPKVIVAAAPAPAAMSVQQPVPAAPPADLAPHVQLAVAAAPPPAPVAAPKPVIVQAPAPLPAVKPSRPARLASHLQLASAVAIPVAKTSTVPAAGNSTPVAAPPPRTRAKPLVLATPIRTERKPTAVSAPRVRVLNAVGRKGLAGRYSHYLQARGWSGLRTADARHSRAMTVIVYPAGARAQAAALARRLPFRATLAASRNGSDLLVLLGNDALAFDNRLRLRVSRT
jgi:hypothetical protein